MQRDENLVYIHNGVNDGVMDNKLMPFTWVTVRPGRSTPADLVQSRSVSELESVLTLVSSANVTVYFKL